VNETLRPLSIGELLDRTFHYYRRHFMLFLGIAAIPGVLRLGLQLGPMLVQRSVAGLAALVVWSLASFAAYVVATMLAQGATMVAVSQIQLGRPTSVSEAFGAIRPRIGELIVLSLNVGLRVLVGLVLLIVPGILVALKYALAVPVAVLEETSVSRSLERSADLTRGHRGRIFTIYVLLILLSVVAGAVWQTPATIAITALIGHVRMGQMPLWAQVVYAFGGFVTQVLTAPVMTIALSLVYYDERVRKEAFDLEHMLHQLDGAAPSPLS
jgi:Membrane domain of glycerophosphoryl diester phosphodiesterase